MTARKLVAAAERQNLRALARAHAAATPETPLEMVGPLGDYRPKNLTELATESDIVLRGTLTPVNTYLGRNEDRILTDYRIQTQQLIAGSAPPATLRTPGNVQPFILTVYGGELRLDGVLVRATDPNRGDIVQGKSYLLFVKRSRSGDAGYYEIYHGAMFEVSENRVKPVFKDGGRIFKDVADSTVEEMIVNIDAARLK